MALYSFKHMMPGETYCHACSLMHKGCQHTNICRTHIQRKLPHNHIHLQQTQIRKTKTHIHTHTNIYISTLTYTCSEKAVRHLNQDGKLHSVCNEGASCRLVCSSRGWYTAPAEDTSRIPPLTLKTQICLQFPRETTGGHCTHHLIIMHNADFLCTVNHFFNIQSLINHLSTQTGQAKLNSSK